MISPKLYREFCLPYVNQLSEEFGGVMIHSCGKFVHQFDNLERVHNLRGINFGATETAFEAVWQRFGGKTAVITHLALNNEIHFKDNREYMAHVLRTRTHNRGLCVIVTPGETELKGVEAGSMTRFAEQVRRTLARFG